MRQLLCVRVSFERSLSCRLFYAGYDIADAPTEDIKANILQTRRVEAVCVMPSIGGVC